MLRRGEDPLVGGLGLDVGGPLCGQVAAIPGEQALGGRREHAASLGEGSKLPARGSRRIRHYSPFRKENISTISPYEKEKWWAS